MTLTLDAYEFSISEFEYETYTEPLYYVDSDQNGLVFYLNLAPPFGAIALNYSTGDSGLSYNWPTIDQAKQSALITCGSGCTVMGVFGRGHCGACAKGPTGWGAATRDTIEEAEEAALDNCSEHSKDCALTVSNCNY